MSKGKSFIDKAISYYVDSYIDFHNMKNDLRYDSFIVKLHIAFTSLFLEIYKKNKPTEYSKKFRKKELCLLTLLNEMQSIDVDWKQNNESCYYVNLKFLILRRDLIVHANTSLKSIIDEERLIFNATFRNFYFLIKKYFPKKLVKIPQMLQLFSYIEESQFTDGQDKKRNAKFLEDFLKKNPDCNKNGNLGYPSLNTTNIIFLSNRDDKRLNSNKPHITVCQVDNPQEAMAQIQNIIDDKHNLTPSEVCNQVNQKINIVNDKGKPMLNPTYSFPKLREFYKIETNLRYCRKIILNPNNPQKRKEQLRYSQACIDYLCDECSKSSEDFIKACR
jgi:hypothetical protein